jgi:serine protease Do
MKLLPTSISGLATTILFATIVTGSSPTTLLSGGSLIPAAVAATTSTLATNQQITQEKDASILTLNLDGEAIQDSFSPADEQSPDGSFYKLYHFEGQAGRTVNIEIDSDEVQPMMTLFQVTESEDGEMDLVQIAVSDIPAQLMANLDTDGSYILRVSNDSNEGTGSYTIKASITP